jgi:hypothetical protein
MRLSGRTIRTYRGLQKVERALHSIRVQPGKHWPLPYPVTWRVAVYLVALEVLIYAVTRTPFGMLVPSSFLIRWVVIPGLAAWLAANSRVDGRFAHVALLDLGAYLKRDRRTSAGRALPARPQARRRWRFGR